MRCRRGRLPQPHAPRACMGSASAVSRPQLRSSRLRERKRERSIFHPSTYPSAYPRFGPFRTSTRSPIRPSA